MLDIKGLKEVLVFPETVLYKCDYHSMRRIHNVKVA